MAWKEKNDEPQTNADRIRSMSDEELATLIADDWCEIVCVGSPSYCNGQCSAKILNWLKQEASDE